jgi:hypothetical protein
VARAVLEAVLSILNAGAQWHMLPQRWPNYKTVYRRFQTWCHSEVLQRVLTLVANELRGRGALDEEERFIDATFAMAKGGGAAIGPTKRGKGLKIMAIVERHGLPLSVTTHAANHHEVRLVPLCFAGWWNASSPGFSGDDACWSAGRSTRRTFSVSSNSLACLSCSGNFEIVLNKSPGRTAGALKSGGSLCGGLPPLSVNRTVLPRGRAWCRPCRSRT